MGLEHLAYTALLCVMSTVGWPGLQSGLARQRNLRKVRSACIASKRHCLDEILKFDLCMLPFSLTAGGGVSGHPCVMLASMLLCSEDVGFYGCALMSARVQDAPCAAPVRGQDACGSPLILGHGAQRQGKHRQARQEPP